MNNLIAIKNIKYLLMFVFLGSLLRVSMFVFSEDFASSTEYHIYHWYWWLTAIISAFLYVAVEEYEFWREREREREKERKK